MEIKVCPFVFVFKFLAGDDKGTEFRIKVSSFSSHSVALYKPK